MIVPPTVVVGLEVCERSPPAILRNVPFGLLMNQASVTCDLRAACDVLSDVLPGQLQTIFTPQHGLWGEQQANMIESPHGKFPDSEWPVYSLYSETRRPTVDMLRGLRAFVIDLQDVGTRVYTFAWTISHCLEACAQLGIPVVILDRPNPLGGMRVEGPLLDPAFASFVGRVSIPMRHGLTMGELTLLVNAELNAGAEVHVVPLQGWQRSMTFAGWKRPWVFPSPNLAHWSSVQVYPGQVLLEGTNLSEGRGTTLPFEVCGAPFVLPQVLIAALERLELPGVKFRPIRFTPKFDKWQGQSCGGIVLHVVDDDTYRPCATSVAILACLRRLWPTDFAWLPPPYEYETVRPPIDIISGSDALRKRLDNGSPLALTDVNSLVHFDDSKWNTIRDRVLLY